MLLKLCYQFSFRIGICMVTLLFVERLGVCMVTMQPHGNSQCCEAVVSYSYYYYHVIHLI